VGGLTGSLLLDWATLAVSLFNTIILLWLGLTIVLSADRRHPGVWLLGGGAFAGALFFVSHTAILGQEMTYNLDGVNFWWRVGWTPITIAPFAWYVVMLWHNGFWLQPTSRLRRRHRAALAVMATLVIFLVVLLSTANFMPSYGQIVQLDLSDTLSLAGVPLLPVMFSLFMVMCILLSIDALRYPAHSPQFNSDLARDRARPWLLAASVILLVVSLLVALFIGSVFAYARTIAPFGPDARFIGVFDLGLSLLIALATTLMGQAVVSYEVFTGKTLPRRGFIGIKIRDRRDPKAEK
jgi:hypothetical protein